MKIFNINVKNRKRLDEIGRDCLEVFAVCGFAAAQPIYSVMSRNSEFFTSYHFSKLDFINLILVLSLVLPLALMAVELAVGLLLGFPARKFLHLSGVCLGVGLVALPLLDKAMPSSVAGPILVGGLIAGVATLCYCASPSLRSCTGLLAAGALIFPLYFLFLTPISQVFFSKATFPKVSFQDKSSPHVFLIVFDEFNSTPLLNDRREIDSVRYPNFAALAREATWFPQASSVSSATILAVPAALDGIKPDHKSSPSINEHPNNLFTILANRYHMNVMEPYTSLFPPQVANETGENQSAFKKLRSSLADLKVVYKHIVYPQPRRAKLPSITHTFKGFAGGTSDPDVVNGIKKSAVYDRDERREQVRKFIRHIRNTPQPSLNFMHVLLPHHFHDYLPSGQFYCPDQLLDGQLLPANAWNNNQELVDLAYQRFMLQVGFTDRMVGEIIKKIKDEGMYDNSLIIFVADHGICFRAGQPIRPLGDGNFPDILSVPLFIKFPNQKRGVKDMRFAETTDLLPTVLETIGAKVDWKLDGHSLLSGQLPERTVKHIYDLDTDTWRNYRYSDITAYPLLNQWHEKFGSGKPLAELHKRSPLEDLVGKPLQSLSVRQSNEFQSEIHEWLLFQQDIDPSFGFVPLYLSGKVKGPASLKPPFDLAVSLNGKICCVTRTYLSGAFENAFNTVLPQAAFKEGKNELVLTLVQRGPDGKLELLTGGTGLPAPYALRDIDSSRPYIQAQDGSRFPIVKNGLLGALEPFTPNPSYTFVLGMGWAVSRPQKVPAKKVLFFADSQFLAAQDISIDREDIKNWLGPEFLRCGFRAELPVAPLLGREIRAYGITADGQAAELDMHRDPGSKSDSAFERFVYYGAAKLETAADGHPVVVLTSDRKLEGQAGNNQGRLEKVEAREDFVHVTGWAASGNPPSLPKAILFFQNGTLAAVRRTNTARPDLALTAANKELRCGFDYNIARSNFSTGNFVAKEIRAIAVFNDDSLCELK